MGRHCEATNPPPPLHSAHVRLQCACSARTVLAGVGANPLKSQPGSRKRPEAGTMGEGDAGTSGRKNGRCPKPEPAGHSPRILQACAGAGIAPSTKPRAGQRAALPCARSYPPPAGQRSRSPCQAEAGEAATRTPPGSQTPARPRRGLGGRRFCPHNSADPALPEQKFCAPHLSGQGPVPSPNVAP